MSVTCNEFSQQIDSYLDGKIAEEKLEAFELHYFECDGCFAELKAAERLRSKEVPIVAPVAGEQKSKAWGFGFKLKPLLTFGTLFLVVLVAVLVMQFDNQANQEKWIEMTQFDSPLYVTAETRGQSLGNVPNFTNAMQEYNSKNYSNALSQLVNLPDSSTNPQVIFFKGICQLRTKETKAALESFDTIIENMDPSYYDEAIYYKAIALLRLNKKEEAVKQLENLSEMFSPYSQKAKDLMAKIK